MMKYWSRAALAPLATICFLLVTGLSHVGAQSSNGVLREVFSNITGSALPDLTNNPAYPNNPTAEFIDPLFESLTGYGDNYGTRMRALVTAPLTGSYIFWTASDDQSAVYLSTDETPATRRLICAEPQWAGSRDWDASLDRRTNATAFFPSMQPHLPANRSDYAYGAITLTAGQRYYIEAIQKEGVGGDNLAVGWTLPGGVQERPIPGNRLTPYGLGPPLISQQPTNFTATEAGSAAFYVRLQRMIGATFLWKRNGVPVPGGTNASLLLPMVTLPDHGSTFFCSITNALGGTNSLTATLSVLADTTRPTLQTVGNLGEPQVVFVAYSEPVEAVSATNAANYAISGGPAGVSVTRAVFGTDTRTVLLTTTPLAAAVTYTLTVNNVRDRATTPNTILANSTRTFSVQVRPLDIGYLSLSREPLGPSTRRHGVVISEVMYHPTNRVDGRNLEFIELYNSQPWFEEVGGWRVSGAIDFTFPSNTVMPSRSFVIVAANPTDFRAVYTGVAATNVFGPFLGSNGLQNSSGTLRLRNARDAVLFEMTFSGEPPYPAHADGGGHSLVLARPSYGERDPRAWSFSDLTGGNPGIPDPVGGNTFRNILINEILAHTDPPQQDYVELFNFGNVAFNVNGMILTDDPDTNKCVISSNIVANTIIPARGFLVLTETQLGFGLSSGGETIFLKNPTSQRVIDAVKFEAQENGIPFGRSPDGATTWRRLVTATPGTNNASYKPSDVVIHEIMYHPISENDDDEYIELHNRSTNAVNLGGWRLRDAVSFNFPNGTVLPAGGYLVVAKNAERLRTNYVGLSTANCLGDYSGSLGNGGQRIELNFPDEVTGTNAQGQLRTNTIHIAVDEVSYGTGGRWGKWSDGDGSSLELRDAHSDRRLAPNWADSDESARSQWVTVEATGVMDHGWADAYQLHVTLLGAGEALVDNIEVIPSGSTNVIGNGTFETGVGGWVFQGNHNDTSWESTEGFASSRSLHLRATGRGDAGANRVRTQLPYTLSPGTVVTLRAKVRWLKGNPNVLLRLRGNWMEALGYTLTTTTLGTPGAPNSGAGNVGPAITEVKHEPALPLANQPVLVLARVNDPDGLAYLAVNYRVDPSAAFTALAMTNNGSGLYSTLIPGQASGATVAFYINALDNADVPAGATFPDDAPQRECVVRWGDTIIPGTLGTYRMWLTQTNVTRWIEQEKMSNKAKDVTFVYGTNRVVYNAGAWFHGSPYHSPSYDSPVGAQCDYDMGFAKDDALLGETDINLFMPGNGCCDATGQGEIQAYWFGAQFGVPFLYCRPVVVYVNGVRRASQIYYDMQQPNGDFVEQWFPDDADGELHKIQLGFEFGDLAYGASEPGYAVVGANLARYTTTGGAFKQARYRATLPLRAVTPREQNDYTNLFNLITHVLTTAPVNSEAYTTTLQAVTDVEEWFKVHVTQHLYNNTDSFSYGGGQNAFAYKPTRDPWKLFLWDVDFAFSASPTDANLTGIGGADHGPRNDHAPFSRIYWQALIEAANGMMSPSRSDTILDARYNGMVAGGASGLGSPTGIKSFIAQRRSYILSQIAANQSPFAITSNGGMDFTTNRNLITLTGTAPLDVRTILVNGAAFPISWTSLNTWVVRVPLLSGLNTLMVTGLNPQGAVVPGVAGTIRVTYTGANELPQDKVVINEIMYNPQFADASFVELFNQSVSNAFDLSGCRLNGIDLDFANGIVIEPQQYLVVARDRTVFGDTYGPSIPVAAEYPGNLDNGGETLTLLAPPSSGGAVMDQVTYDDDLPWPAAADGFGPSLQLMDPARDNNRVANWGAANAGSTNPPQTLITLGSNWRYQQTLNLDGSNWTAAAYNDTAWQSGAGLLAAENCNCLPELIRTTLTVSNGRITFYFRARFTLSGSPAGAALKIWTVLDDGAVFYLNGQEVFRQGMPGGAPTYGTLATPGVGDATGISGPFIVPGNALVAGENVLAVEVHQSGSTSTDVVFGMRLETTYDVVNRYTPGAVNSIRSSLAAFPTIWLNEVLATNFFLGTNGITDRFGERDPWVELYNGGTGTVPLAGFFLANNYSNLTQWAFPANASIGPRQFLVVWLDGETNESNATEFHASFRAAPGLGSIVLTSSSNAPVLDYLNYVVPSPGRSYGSYPDGAVSGRRTFSAVTPGGTNNPATPPVDVRINEWMADNFFTLDDPGEAGPNYEDWFELFNPATNAVDLTGYFLSDSLTNVTHWRVPDGTVIGPRGYLLVWADGEPQQNGNYGTDLHAPFSLSSGGEAIGLFAPDGQLVDGVTFGFQITDISQGRFPDGNASVTAMTNATPRSSNVVASDNTPPTMALINDRTMNEGTTLFFAIQANDTNVPAQSLTFSLDPGAPTNATLHPTGGTFSWTPTESQGPGVYPITLRVTDNGVPPLSATRTFTVTVNEINNAPVLAPLLSRNVPEGNLLTVTNSATDSDNPPQRLTFSLDAGAPTNATINPTNGLFTWTPTEGQGPGNYSIVIRVTDDGDPALSDAKSLSVFVSEVNQAPVLSFASPRSVHANATLAFTAGVMDADLPAQLINFSLDAGAPANAVIDSATGAFNWTPTVAQVGTNVMTVRATDSAAPPASGVRVLTVVVAPALSPTITQNGAQVRIAFPTLAGRSYRVDYKDELDAANWTALGSPVTAVGSSLTFQDDLGAAEHRFYRAVLMEP